MHNADCKERNLNAPGYLDGAYILDWMAAIDIKRGLAYDPQDTRKQSARTIVAI